MSAEENKKILKKYFAAFNSHDFAVIDPITEEMFQPSWISNSPGDHTLPGRKQLLRKVIADHPDFQMIIEEIVAEDDNVVTIGRYHWTDAAAGEIFEKEFIGFARFRKGKIAELRELNAAAVKLEAAR